jgi:hypothetical protein
VVHTAVGPETDFLVDDAVAAYDRLLSAGAQSIREPFDVQIGKCAVVIDPWGNVITVIDCTKGLLKMDDQKRVIGNIGDSSGPEKFEGAAPPVAPSISEELFEGYGAAFMPDGTPLPYKSYKLTARRTFEGDGIFQFVETKAYPDGSSYQVPFTIDVKGRTFNSRDMGKEISGFSPSNGIVVARQKFPYYEGDFTCHWDANGIRTVHFSKEMVIYEVLKPASGATCSWGEKGQV